MVDASCRLEGAAPHLQPLGPDWAPWGVPACLWRTHGAPHARPSACCAAPRAVAWPALCARQPSLQRPPRRAHTPAARPPTLRSSGQKLRPDFALSFEFGTHSSARGDGSAVFVAGGHGGGSFDVQQRFKVAKGMALEVGRARGCLALRLALRLVSACLCPGRLALPGLPAGCACAMRLACLSSPCRGRGQSEADLGDFTAPARPAPCLPTLPRPLAECAG